MTVRKRKLVCYIWYILKLVTPLKKPNNYVQTSSSDEQPREQDYLSHSIRQAFLFGKKNIDYYFMFHFPVSADNVPH